MKIRWRQHEILFITSLGTILLAGYLWQLYNYSPDLINTIYATPFIANQVPFNLYRNVLLPDVGIGLLIYLSYLTINLMTIPRFMRGPFKLGWTSTMLKKCLWLLVQAGLAVLLLGIGFTTTDYFRNECYYQYSGFTFFPGNGSHPLPLLGIDNEFHQAVMLVGAYGLYSFVREMIIRILQMPGRVSAYRVLICNQITAWMVAYTMIPFAAVSFHFMHGQNVEAYFSFTLPVFLVFMINVYWLFPIAAGRTLVSRYVVIRLLILTFLCTLPLILSPFHRVVPIAWAALLLIETPVSWLFYQQKKDKILQLRGAERALVKSRTDLQFLRAQINPHFLFNILNTLYGTALQENAERAAGGIQKLGDMMRFMLHENNLDFIAMNREIEYLKNYIALQKLRINPSGEIQIEDNIREQNCNHRIAPMLLIPLIENAFKHGISLTQKSWIKISLDCSKTNLLFEVRNSRHPLPDNDPEKEQSGVGLRNVTERLKLIYPGKHELTVDNNSKEFLVRLSLKFIVSVSMIVIFASSVFAQNATTRFAQNATTRQLDELITAYAGINKFNGSVLVAQKGQILLEKGYGLRNVQEQSVNDSNTMFEIGSITKEFTAFVILKLVEQNKLKLTDKLTMFYPKFPGGDSISIENLLTHTSGIFNYTEINDFWHRSSHRVAEREVLDSLKSRPLSFAPGEKFSYSNSNYMLLAYIIQKVTHSPYEAIVRNWIFKPAGMTHSGFDFAGLKDSNKATGYWNFSAMKTMIGPIGDSTQFIGSGEIYSTVGDLYKWHQALQFGRLLNDRLMKSAYLPFKAKYGYGWEIDSVCNRRTVGHEGRMYGFEAKMTRVPEDDIFVILMANESEGPYLHAMSNKIIAIICRLPYDAPEQPLKLSAEKLKVYTGSYAFDADHLFDVQLVNDHLFGTEQGGEAMELFPMKNHKFKFFGGHEGEEGSFTFSMDDHGNATGMSTKNPRGIELNLKKVK